MTRLCSVYKKLTIGHLGGSVGWASNFGPGHDFTVCEFEPGIGLCANSSELEACFRFWVSVSAPPPPVPALSLSVALSQK